MSKKYWDTWFFYGTLIIESTIFDILQWSIPSAIIEKKGRPYSIWLWQSINFQLTHSEFIVVYFYLVRRGTWTLSRCNKEQVKIIILKVQWIRHFTNR